MASRSGRCMADRPELGVPRQWPRRRVRRWDRQGAGEGAITMCAPRAGAPRPQTAGGAEPAPRTGDAGDVVPGDLGSHRSRLHSNHEELSAQQRAVEPHANRRRTRRPGTDSESKDGSHHPGMGRTHPGTGPSTGDGIEGDEDGTTGSGGDTGSGRGRAASGVEGRSACETVW